MVERREGDGLVFMAGGDVIETIMRTSGVLFTKRWELWARDEEMMSCLGSATSETGPRGNIP